MEDTGAVEVQNRIINLYLMQQWWARKDAAGSERGDSLDGLWGGLMTGMKGVSPDEVEGSFKGAGSCWGWSAVDLRGVSLDGLGLLEHL